MKNKNKFEYVIDKKVGKKLNCKTINIPIYRFKINMLFGKDSVLLEKEWGHDNDNKYGALTRDYLKQHGDITISFFEKIPNLDTVVHELYHSVDMIMNYIGHERCKQVDEPSAYLIGYLINEYKKIAKYK